MSMEQVLRIEGWSSRSTKRIGFYRCPKCGDSRSDFLLEKSDGTVECYACDMSSPRSSFAVVKKRRLVGQCARCGAEVPFVPSADGIVGPLCPELECSNYVAVHFGSSFIQPSLALDLAWNTGLPGRAECIRGSLFSLVCKTKKDLQVLALLQVLAKQDDKRFKFGDPNEYRAALCFDWSRRKYLGFLVWTENDWAVLRQIFVVSDERRKGHAATLVSFWVERYANKLGDKFGIEEPNEKALALHVKLGHVKLEGADAVGLKCSFV